MHVQQEQPRQNQQHYAQDDMLEVPAFLRNRKNRG